MNRVEELADAIGGRNHNGRERAAGEAHAPFCINHVTVDHEGWTICFGEDLPTPRVETSSGPGYIGLSYSHGDLPEDGTGLRIDVSPRGDVMTVEQAEQVAYTILRQVAAARRMAVNA